jgi:hypothetical protein
MVPLIHLIYASAAVREPTHEELAELLLRARANNERLGVTGALLYAHGSYFQVLEGRPSVVDALFAKIALDPRHERAATIIREPIARRTFGDWSMGYPFVSETQVAELAGLNDFFGKASFLERLNASRAKKLLAAFGGGRWRIRPGSVPSRQLVLA